MGAVLWRTSLQVYASPEKENKRVTNYQVCIVYMVGGLAVTTHKDILQSSHCNGSYHGDD